jgi:1-acyl-sn-glycerol-3-phosphate acyltransferase
MTRVYRVSRWIAWCLCRLWFRARAVGLEHVPADGGVLLASNHASHLDPMLLGIFLPQPCHYVARQTLGRIPLVGRWMRAVGVLFIDRKAPGRVALGRAIDALRAGKTVGMFPEGTRSPDGRLQPFHNGVLLLLKKSDATVVPVGIRGSFSAFPKGAVLPRPRRCTVHYGRPRSAAEVLAPGGLDALASSVLSLPP